MSDFDPQKDYYRVLGADEQASRRDLERLYKRIAAKIHPDRGGSEEEMKTLNEAYSILKDEGRRKEYDAERAQPTAAPFKAFSVASASAPSAQDIGVFGHCLSAFLCLLIGLFLLLLVRFQWMWFLWPLAILAGFVTLFGIIMARNAMVAVNSSLAATNPLRGHTMLQEAMFWSAVGGGAYGVYLLLTSVG